MLSIMTLVSKLSKFCLFINEKFSLEYQNNIYLHFYLLNFQYIQKNLICVGDIIIAIF